MLRAVTRRSPVLLAAALTAAAVLAGCGAGPSTRPPLAMVDPRLAPTAAKTAPRPTTPTPPPLQAPTANLVWTDCTATTLTRLGLSGGPAGLMLECAQVRTRIDVALTGAVSLGVLRARLPQTPTNTAPLVLLSGADGPATTALAQLAVGPGSALVASRPVLALDRRGSATSSPITCLSAPRRNALIDLDPGDTTQGDPQAAAVRLGRDAAVSCTDALSPAEGAFDGAHAADDVDALRRVLGVDTLAVLGSGGGGGAVALRDALRHPQRVSRLILDSPLLPGSDQVSTAHAQARGAEAAFDAFAVACAAAGCPVADPRQTVLSLQQQARSSGGLPAAAGRRVSAGAVLIAVRQALLSPASGGSAGLGQALAGARGGDASRLLALADAATGRSPQGGDVGRVDSELVANCSDAALRPTAGQVRDLLPRWAQESPLFGADAAIRLLVCQSWPTPPAAPALTGLAGLPPVLVVGSTIDPVLGPDAATTTERALEQAGAGTGVLRRQGSGHPVLANSPCALTVVIGYVADGSLPTPGTLCPP